MPNLTRLSKFISLVLRHRAGEFGLHLDPQGYVDYAELRRVVAEHLREEYGEVEWQTVLSRSLDGKRRFELTDGRIRALYGHSRVESVTYPRVEPPEVLYHGTTPQAIKSIRKDGLRSMKRQYVHLSTNIERAYSVGNRRTKTVILLKIKALEAHHAGLEFFHPEREHFLVKSVPPQFIEFPES